MPSFERDIRPLFRDRDISAMRSSFDLSQYTDVQDNAQAIYERLADGSMPCDGPWPVGGVQQLALSARPRTGTRPVLGRFL